MRFLESLLYGLFSGLAEFLPISSQAHQALLMQIFGRTQREPLRDLLVHIALIIALMLSASSLFSRVSQERGLSRNRKSVNRRATSKYLMDLQLVCTAAIPMVIMLLIYLATGSWEFNPTVMMVVLIINGIIILVPDYMRHGNKDSRAISAFEAIIIGVASGLSFFPGISRTGACLSSAVVTGSNKQNGANWALMLALPALATYIMIDIIRLIAFGLAGVTFLAVLGYLVSAITAFIGGYLSVIILRFITERANTAVFAFYSWGMALFGFLLYLIT